MVTHGNGNGNDDASTTRTHGDDLSCRDQLRVSVLCPPLPLVLHPLPAGTIRRGSPSQESIGPLHPRGAAGVSILPGRRTALPSRCPGGVTRGESPSHRRGCRAVRRDRLACTSRPTIHSHGSPGHLSASLPCRLCRSPRRRVEPSARSSTHAARSTPTAAPCGGRGIHCSAWALVSSLWGGITVLLGVPSVSELSCERRPLNTLC